MCIAYIVRKKRERHEEKNKLLSEIDNIKLKLSNNASTPAESDDSLLLLEELEDKMNKIYDFETKGRIIRSKIR